MLWFKAFHILFVIAWLAGVFYLPRIFVHYAEGRALGEDVRRLVVMARRLFGFMTVMAVLAIGFGLIMSLVYHDTGLWLMIKLGFVAILLAYHGVCRLLLGRLTRAEPMPGALALRLFNEAALLIVLPIIIFAVVKPF